MSSILEALRNVDLQKIEETENIVSEVMRQLGFNDDDIADMKDDSLKRLFTLEDKGDLTENAVESCYQALEENICRSGIVYLEMYTEDGSLFFNEEEYTGGEVSLPIYYHLGDLNEAVREAEQNLDKIILDVLEYYYAPEEPDVQIEIAVNPDFEELISEHENIIPKGFETDEEIIIETVEKYRNWNKELFDLSLNINEQMIETSVSLYGLIDTNEEIHSQLTADQIQSRLSDFIESVVYDAVEQYKAMTEIDKGKHQRT